MGFGLMAVVFQCRQKGMNSAINTRAVRPPELVL